MLKALGSGGIEVYAPAKLNLHLEILGKRSDGYHELETLMIRIGLHDVLRIQPSACPGVTLRSYWCGALENRPAPSMLPVDSRNLVVKAAELLARAASITQGVQIDLMKRIPLAAGLAGGSSDAAATLLGLNQLWGLNLSSVKLCELGAELGSDVPFFLADCSAAVCRGRGEKIEAVEMGSALHFVVVKPPVGLSTAEVFKGCRVPESRQTVEGMVRSLQCGNLDQVGALLLNRLSQPAQNLCANIEQLTKLFAHLPFVGHLMSGSGTSYFGLCRNRSQSEHLAGWLRSQNLGSVYQVQSCA